MDYRDSLRELQNTVIANNFCIGCGACAAVAPDAIQVKLSDDGFFRAFLLEDDEVTVENNPLSVCPFSDASENEDRIAARVFPELRSQHSGTGRYLACYAGYVTDAASYAQSSSGGLAKWILKQLLEERHVDYVVQVFEQDGAASGGQLYGYDIVTTPEDVGRGARSAYYPVEMSGVLKRILETPGRYAITGVPCFIKAVRNLCRENPVLGERIAFTIGIICGHMKSSDYGSMIGWQLGVPPKELGSIDFRVKLPDRRAKEKGVHATSLNKDAPPVQAKVVQELFGTNYGDCFFMNNACDYCDDVTAETADVSVGDAWLPEFLDRGTSVIVIRNDIVGRLVDEGIRSGSLVAKPLTETQVAKSQEGGLRHRRMGLAYRLHIKRSRGQWYPTKRVAPSADLSFAYKAIFRMRRIMARVSVVAFRWAKAWEAWWIFKLIMVPLTKAYFACYKLLSVQDRWRRLKLRLKFG